MPKPPRRDSRGNIVPHDHEDILPDYHVVRHTTPKDVPKGQLESGAFSESSGGGMSVDIEEWMAAEGLGPLHYVSDPTHGAVRLNVGKLRELGLKVGWDPDNAHKHHGAVWGIGNGSKRKRRVRDIADTIKRAEGESLPIPRRDPLAQAQSRAALADNSTTRSASEFEATMETVPICAVNGEVLAYDIYVFEAGRRTWLGSRRTLPQCQDAFIALCRPHK